jgi:hypothetical protein
VDVQSLQESVNGCGCAVLNSAGSAGTVHYAKFREARKERCCLGGEEKMFWIATALTLVAGILALMVVTISTRPADVDELGSMSNHWLAEHRVGSV